MFNSTFLKSDKGLIRSGWRSPSWQQGLFMAVLPSLKLKQFSSSSFSFGGGFKVSLKPPTVFTSSHSEDGGLSNSLSDDHPQQLQGGIPFEYILRRDDCSSFKFGKQSKHDSAVLVALWCVGRLLLPYRIGRRLVLAG